MSHFYNPYSTDQQSSTQTGNGHSSAQVQSDRQKTSHSNYGSGYRSAPSGLSPNIPSLFALPLPAFMAGQSRPAKEEELKRSADLHSDRAREESLHPSRSYAINPLSQGHRKAVAECSDRSLNWLPTYKSTNEDNASKYYTPAASSIFPGGGESRTSAASSIFSGGCESRFTTNVERKPHEQSISGLGEYKFPVREIASAQPKLSQCKYTSELASNILLHFGLEKEDLEQLISYPEDQITPQNLPFILRQIRQQKTTNPVSAVQTVPYPESKTTTSVSDTDFRGHMKEASHQDYRPRGILKTSKVIDYGHVSQLSAGPGEEVGMASEAHSDGSSTLLMDSGGREAKEMSISLLISPRDQESSVPGLVSPLSFKITSKSLPTKNPPKEFSPPPKQFLQTVKVPFTKPKTDTDSRILPGVSKSLSLKDPEPSQLKSSKPHLSDTPSPSVASGRLGVVLYDSLKDPLKQVSKVPEPKQQQPPVQQKEKKQQPATQRSPTSQVDTSRSVPTPNQMYDYAAITPGMYPHSCSLCDKECFSVKEWINHQNTELHLENCKLLRTRFPEWDGQLLTSLSASDVYARSSTARPSQSRKKSQNSSSRSRSRSYSPRRYRGSGSRRDQERSRYRSRSRSYSPRQSSRRTRRSRTRSRSQSPLYRSTTSRYRSRSRSYERRSSPRRRDDRLSSAKRSRSRERRSSEKSSAEKMSKEGKVVEMTDGKQKTGLTMGEMMEENLLLKRITCVEMKRVFSPEFASSNRRVLHITNLPKYEEGSYTERDVANLLTPFGFQHEDEHLHNIYVIPQKCMALAVLPTAKMAVKIIRASVKDCFKLSGCKLIVKILEDRISTPLVFYRVLMKWMNEKMKSHYAKNIVFVKKISPSEARNLREVLKKIGNVMNYVPLLNKVFIHFFRIHEVDRFGIWYSLLRQPPQHSIYRLVTPWGKKTVSRLKGWARALPDLSLRVTDANLPTISSIPLGCGPPFYVTMTTFPFIFPTICPWFNIPSFQDPSAVKLPSHYSTIMMTGLPEDGYCQLHVARMVWSLFHQRNIHSLFYRVMVLPLQRRAFIYFNTHESCREFSQRHMTKPFCIKNKPVNIHFVNDNTNPGLTEETMYRQLLKLSNAHVPMLSGLDQRLLLVQVSEVSLKLIMAVMKEVVSVGRLAGFLPLGNRICIEMLEPSDRMKVMEAKLGSLTAPHIWKKVIRVDTVQSLHQHQLQSLDVTIDLEEDLHWAAPDQTAQDSNKNQSLDGLSFQVLDSIDDEGTADREESGEPQAETSFQALDSVTEDQSATDHVTEVAVAENVSNETKVSTFAKRPRRGRGGKRERKPKVLAANKDITGQENFKVIDLVENPIETEDPEPTSQDVTPEAELEPIKEEEVYQVIDSVAEQSAPNAMKKQGHRGRPTRRSARGRTSEGESEEKQDETRTISEVTKPDSITNKEGVNKVPCTVLDSAGSETIQKTEKVWRRRSTRGNKEEKIISQTASSKEEPKYQVIDSVEDDVAPEEAVMVTKATRGRRGRPAKRDIPTRGHTAAKECEEGKEMSPKALAEASGQSDKATASLEEGQCEDKVVGNHRKELMGPEAKRSRSQSPDVPADVTLLTYNPSNPLGQEFVVPKAGFFCNICSIFYMNENTAKEVHCSSRRHFDNLKKYYLKLKTTPSRASSSTSSNVSSDRM